MDVNIYKVNAIKNEEVKAKVKSHESFIIDCGDTDQHTFLATVETIEKIIEDSGLKCRIYTVGRIATLGAAAWTGVGSVIAAGAGLAIAAHNIATWSPDYEIGKNIITKHIYVNYKK